MKFVQDHMKEMRQTFWSPDSKSNILYHHTRATSVISCFCCMCQNCHLLILLKIMRLQVEVYSLLCRNCSSFKSSFSLEFRRFTTNIWQLVHRYTMWAIRTKRPYLPVTAPSRQVVISALPEVELE